MKIKLSIILFFAIALISSCKKDFLDVFDNTVRTRQGYIKDLTTMQEFMNGIHLSVSEIKRENRDVYSELIADNIKPVPNASSNLNIQYTWAQQASNLANDVALSSNIHWIRQYQEIRSLNFVLEDVDKYKAENPELASQIKGQAYALRALYYFNLVNTFAQAYKFTPDGSHPGVPYITTSNVVTPYTRQTVAEVYNGIVSDFKASISLLPSTVSDTRYINSPAAKALLARTYLYMEDFNAAKALALEISTSFPLMTIAEGYPNDLFKYKGATSNESLFQIPPSVSNAGDRYATSFLSRRLRGFASISVLFLPTSDISDLLREDLNDARQSWVSNISGQTRVTKFPVGVVSGMNPPEGSYYPAVIRSSEMFLTVAEAAAKTSDEGTARTYLDAVRKRANPTAVSTTATGQALINLIYKERRKELAFEGTRMYDLQRWKLGVNRVDANLGVPKILPFGDNKAIAPIPLVEVRLAGIPQNPGY